MAESNRNIPSFEQQWANAFDGAELQPLEQVWMNVEGQLANSDAKKYKRGVFFYRMLAAASLFIAMVLGITLFLQNQPGTEMVTSNGQTIPLVIDSVDHGDGSKSNSLDDNLATLGPGAANRIGSGGNDSLQVSIAEDHTSREARDPVAPIPNAVVTEVQAVLAIADDRQDRVEEDTPDILLGSGDSNLPLEYRDDFQSFQVAGLDLSSSMLQGSDLNIDPDIHLYNVPIPRSTEKLRVSSNQLWAGLGLSTGNFDPNIGAGGSVDEARVASFDLFQEDEFNVANDPVLNEEDYDPGISYSIALNGGWQFAPRWILQGGIQYQLSQSSTQSNLLVENTATNESTALTELSRNSDTFENAADLQLSQADLNLENNFQFLSLPVKVGFLVLDRKFHLGVNTGVSTDLFLRNRVNESNNLVDSFSETPGENSPFRRTFFSGILGLELGYKFLKNYSVTIEPTYRRSINSFTKESVGVNSNPSSLGVTAGFRYLFR